MVADDTRRAPAGVPRSHLPSPFIPVLGVPVPARVLGFALALAFSVPAIAAPGASAASPAPQAASAASTAMIGEWRVLGPASQAHLTQMIRLTVRALPPTEADFRAARLDDDQAAQVRAGRARIASEPDSEAVKGLKRDWLQLDGARASVTPSRITLRFGGDAEAFTYEVLREEGVRLQVQMDGPGGAQEVLFTVVDDNTMMFGPMGAEPTVLYRLGAP